MGGNNFPGRRMEMVAPTIMYRLICGHAAKGPATLVSGMLRCGPCRDMQIITGVIVMEWRAKCETCNFGRWSGMDETTAQIHANGHRSRNPGHRIKVRKMQNPDAQRTLVKWQSYRAAMGAE